MLPSDPMNAALLSAASPDPIATDHFVYLRVDWQGYEELLEQRGERSVPRMTYLEGLVELMTPSRHHETDKKRLARLVEAWSEIAGVALEGYGSWTVKDEAQERGLEPDECYTIRRVVDDEDRPDFAIEVIWTSGGIDKLDVYRKLGVREVWFYERGALRFYALRVAAGNPVGDPAHPVGGPADNPADGLRYAEIPRSELPELPVDRLLSCMKAPSQAAAVRALRDAMAAEGCP